MEACKHHLEKNKKNIRSLLWRGYCICELCEQKIRPRNYILHGVLLLSGVFILSVIFFWLYYFHGFFYSQMIATALPYVIAMIVYRLCVPLLLEKSAFVKKISPQNSGCRNKNV